MYRLDSGRPIREAMDQAGLSINALAEHTRRADPAGYGIKPATIGHMLATGASGRERFTDRSAHLVTTALSVALGRQVELFSTTPTLGHSHAREFSSSRRKETSVPLTTAPDDQLLVNQAGLCTALDVSEWVINTRITDYPRDHPNRFPVEYIGRQRRYEVEVARAWFDWEDAGFPEDAVPAALSAWYAARSGAPTSVA